MPVINSAVDRRWATIAETAQYLNLHYQTVKRLAARGRLPAHRGLGDRIIRLDLNEVDAALAGDAS